MPYRATLAEILLYIAEHQREFFRGEPAGVYIAALSATPETLWITENVSLLTGHPHTRFVTEPHFWTEGIHPEDRPRVRSEIGSAGESNTVVFEYRRHHADGSVRWFREQAALVRLAAGSYILGIFRDITESVAAALEVEKSEAELKGLLRAAPTPLVAIDRDQLVTSWNPAAERLFGWTEEEVLGRPLPHLPAEHAEVAMDGIRRVLSGETVAPFESRRVRKDGQLIDVRITVAPLAMQDGTIAGVIGVLEDVTERNREEERSRAAQLALKESDERFRRLFHQSPTPTLLLGEREGDFLILDYNAAADRLTQGRMLTLAGRRVSKIYEGRPDMIADVHRSYAARSSFTREYRHEFITTGETKHLQTTYTFVPPDIVMVQIVDMTERVRMEQELRGSREQLRELSARMLMTQERERMEISRALNDEFGQTLAALKIDLSTLSGEQAKAAEPVGRRIVRMREMIERTIVAVRRLAGDLRPTLLEHAGLAAALESECERFSERTGIACTLDVSSIPQLDPERSTIAFRVAQEALWNLAAHSARAHPSIEVHAEDDSLVFAISDLNEPGDGGIPLSPESVGVTAIRERLRQVGGELEIESGPPRSILRARLPLGLVSQSPLM